MVQCDSLTLLFVVNALIFDNDITVLPFAEQILDDVQLTSLDSTVQNCQIPPRRPVRIARQFVGVNWKVYPSRIFEGV